jgi:hypothetical protein
MTLPPLAAPCGSCPYRRDVPSGVWAPEEYDKLPRFDRETGEQPTSVFLCHQQDGRLCAGWVGCHDMDESLGLRLAVLLGTISGDTHAAALDYSTDVDLFASGAEAAAHGLLEVETPSSRAVRTIQKLRQRKENA